MINDPLLEPFQLRHLRLRNRIVSTAHAPAYQEGGHPRQRYRLYHEEKARGGLGLTIIGGSTNVAPDSPSVFGQLYAGDDSILPWFRALTSGVRSEGAAIMCQITHMGRRTAWDDGHWLPVIGPSRTRERAHRAWPKAMEAEDIRRVITQFADAAKRCRAGGFDGIELLVHAHLLGQFLSPLVNKRQDDYGGCLENRLRLTLQVVEAVRAAIGPEMILGLRITGDELTPGGLSGDDCVEVAQRLADTGAIDFLDVLAGAPYDDLGLAGWVAPMGQPSAPHLSVAGRIRQAVNLPILHAGAVADVASARHAIAGGQVDLIGMTRAHMADPHLVNKLAQGQEARIRPCVGLGYCVDRVNQGKPAVCGHNAATGREARFSHRIEPAARSQKVVVVGGGPGGLEAARICAERGHKVVLFEASERLGGQLNLAAKGKTRRQIWGVADWLIQEVTRLAVDLRLNHYAEADDVRAEAPDLVVIATGGWPEPPDIPGGSQAVSCWEVLSGAARLSGEVLVYDEMGDHSAMVCADLLSEAGCRVQVVTPDRTVAQELGPTNMAVALRDLAAKGVAMACFWSLEAAARQGAQIEVTLRHVLSGEQRRVLVDHLVVELGNAPMDALYFDLKPDARNLGQLDQESLLAGQRPFQNLNPSGDFMLARLGDVVAGRNIHAALYDALRICKDA